MTHLSIIDREAIEISLKELKNFTEIADLIHKHRTTIAKEILNHRMEVQPNTFGRTFVKCALEPNCENFHGTGCTRKCFKFIPLTCPSILLPPYVCNACKKKSNCTLQKFYYRSKQAHDEYLLFRSESRQGLHFSKELLKQIDETLAPLFLNNKQSVNQVYINHPDILTFSKTEFYRLIDMGVFSFRNIDLPRRVVYKCKNNRVSRRTRKEALIRINRTYNDYLKFIEIHKEEDLSIVQMDTVEGRKGGKCFLTLLLIQYNLMLIFLIDAQTTECVASVFNNIKSLIGISEFKRIFTVILTDNGHEFYDPENIEIEPNTGEVLSHIFYCDPSASYQKGAIEKNHEYIRYYLPKPSSFDNLNQHDCDKLMSHINSVPREILKGRTPYNESIFFMDKEILAHLGIQKIEPDDVSLSSDLLKKKDKNY